MPKRTLARRKKSGFNLPEVMLAAVIFATVAYAMLSVWVTHAKAVDKAEQLLAATHIAEAHLTEQMGLGFRSVNTTGTTTITRFFDNVPRDYVFTWTVSVQDTTVDMPAIKNVQVTVSWLDAGQPRSIEMGTCVYWAG